ncbi:P-loop containing nucleoside triphosphate hydrolase protein [Ramaria rubella]|nr:P-loop containing nucleoside triphosphate hydrolase protein [Ramaria rubella]
MASFRGVASFAEGGQYVGIFNGILAFMGLSASFPSFVSNPLIMDSVKLLMLGSLIETGQRLLRWVVSKFRFRYSVSAEFKPGNLTYDWLVSYMEKEEIWCTPKDFVVETRSSQRKWKIDTSPEYTNVDYVPVHGSAQFFRWKGYLLEVSSGMQGGVHINQPPNLNPTPIPYPVTQNGFGNSSLFLTIYTLDTSVLFSFVEECRQKYTETTKPYVTVHAAGGSDYGGDRYWGSVKTKHRRPLDSLLLDEGVINTLLADARQFLELEDWYIKAGIPHRRGYLLHGPPGTGKTSTVYTIAGELGLEIYSLSLSSAGMSDDQLVNAVSHLPPRGILLIEDIDCAFPSREDEEEDMGPFLTPMRPGRRHGGRRPLGSRVTLSGLLNMLDGIGSEEGKIFFATTNHIDRLDSALLRPGRIDRKIEYKQSSQKQARALFKRFFPAARFNRDSNPTPESVSGTHFEVQYASDTDELANDFARAIPEHEFSVAELQGYLLDWKMRPLDALSGVTEWVVSERTLRRERQEREKLRKERVAAAKLQEQLQMSSAVMAGIGGAMAQASAPRSPPALNFVPPLSLTPTSPESKGSPRVDSGTVSPATASREERDTTTATHGATSEYVVNA